MKKFKKLTETLVFFNLHVCQKMANMLASADIRHTFVSERSQYMHVLALLRIYLLM